MLTLLIVTLFAISAIMEVSAQKETCTLKAENAQCARNSECCSSCCTAGLCSLDAECFTACSPTVLATEEGPDLCRLTKSFDELIELVRTSVNRDLGDGVPVLVRIIRLWHLFLQNPMSALTNITDVVQNAERARSLLEVSEADALEILSDISAIIFTTSRLFDIIMSNFGE